MLTPHRWRKVEGLFEEARQLPRADRRHFLETRCTSDPLVRREVDTLLLALDEPSDFLEEGWESLDAHPGPSVGGYRIIEPVGRGGMGTVYRAEGASGEQVAIKFIRAGLDTAAFRRRFELERQALAQVSHPHIAGLRASGIAPDGRQYLAMEFVTGERLDEYAAAKQANVRDKAALLVQLCDAVAAAHARKLLHRDLKPSNVLVTPQGDVKLLDFGLVKLLDEEPTAQEQTRTTQRILTPEYASPEQLRGEWLDERSDVYSLGVIAYELFAGRRPFQAGYGTRRGIGPLLDRTEPDALSGELPRDLRLLIGKALAKDPAARYPSAAELQHDLESFLASRPVTARRGARRQQAWRWLHAHGAVAAGLATAVLLLVGVAMALAVSPRWRQAAVERWWPLPSRRVVLTEWRNLTPVDNGPAAQRLTKALRTELAATGVFDVERQTLPFPTDEPSTGAETIVLATLAASGEDLKVQLRFVEGRNTLANVSGSGKLTDVDSLAVQLAARAAGAIAGERWLQRRLAAADPALREGQARLRALDAVAARPLFEQAVRNHADSIVARTHLATALRQLGFHKQANAEADRARLMAEDGTADEQWLAEAVVEECHTRWHKAAPLRRQLFERFPQDGDHAAAYLNALLEAHDWSTAEAAIATLRQQDDGAEFLPYAALRLASGRRDPSAQRAAAVALKERARALGSTPLLAEALRYEGLAQTQLGERPAGEALLAQARHLAAAAGQREQAATIERDLASSEMEGGKIPAAIARLQRLLPEAARSGSVELEQATLVTLGAAYQRASLLNESRDYSTRALASAWETDNRDRAARLAYNLGILSRELGRLSEARQRYEEALTYRRKFATPAEAGNVLLALAELSCLTGQPRQAAKQLDEARTLLGAQPRRLLDAQLLGLWARRLTGDAGVLGGYAAAVAEAQRLERQTMEAWIEQDWGEALLAFGRPQEAEPHLRTSIRIRLAIPALSSAAETEGYLARALHRLGRTEEARRLLISRQHETPASARLARALARAEIAGDAATWQSLARECRSLGFLPLAITAGRAAAQLSGDGATLARLNQEAGELGLGIAK